MNRNRLVLLILLAGLLSCNMPKGEEIDSQFIKSSSYTRFSKRLEQEQQETAERLGSFRSQLQALSACSTARRLSLPLNITESFIKKKLNRNRQFCQRIYSDKGRSDTLQTLGMMTLESAKLIWVIYSRPSIYQNKDLFLASFTDEKLRDFEQVGTYRDNLAEDITTDIQVRKESQKIYIKVNSARTIHYPIVQKNIFKVLYLIDTKGIIKKI